MKLETKLEYPFTRIENTIESHADVEISDPYQWLESNTEEVRQWQTAQSQLASDYVSDWPHIETLQKGVEHFLIGKIGTLPRFVNGQWFRADKPETSSQVCVLISETVYGNGRVVFDPASDNLDKPPLLLWLSPSPDGKIVAVGLCADGSENNTIRLIDVDSGKLLPNVPPQLVMDGSTGGCCWLPDSTGFYFQALKGDPHDYRQHILFHDLATGGQTLAGIPIPELDTQEDLPECVIALSPQGRYLVVSQGIVAPRPIAIRDLHDPVSYWKPFITDVSGTVAGFVMNDRLIAFTDIGAPRGRVVAIPLEAKDPNDPANWLELVPESEAVIRSITPVGHSLYLTELVDTYSRIRITDMNGNAVGYVPLPGKGAVVEPNFHAGGLVPKGHPDEYLFAFSSFTQSCGVYHHRPGNDRELEVLKEPKLRLKKIIVEDRWATSEDGTQIPYHSVRLASTQLTTPQPTLIYGYGGFNLPHYPHFPAHGMAAFVAAGGVYIHSHLRGGGEFGSEWGKSGRRNYKESSYLDLYAIAEDLISNKETTSKKLAVSGSSNGGLMGGVALTKRPELWKAVVSCVPILDLMAGLRHPYGRLCIKMEYACGEDLKTSKGIGGLINLSPYHQVKDGVAYPAVFIIAGDTDPRCPPQHSRKFAARLQKANASDSPILLHVWENAGHGPATAGDIQIKQVTESLAFLMKQLDMMPV